MPKTSSLAIYLYIIEQFYITEICKRFLSNVPTKEMSHFSWVQLTKAESSRLASFQPIPTAWNWASVPRKTLNCARFMPRSARPFPSGEQRFVRETSSTTRWHRTTRPDRCALSWKTCRAICPSFISCVGLGL